MTTSRLIANSLRFARRAAVLVVGSTVLLVGVAMVVLPGPAVVVLPLGLGLLGLEFAWARRWLDRVRRQVDDARHRITGRGRADR